MTVGDLIVLAYLALVIVFVVRLESRRAARASAASPPGARSAPARASDRRAA